MNCTNCGNEMPMGAAACPYCGTPAPMDMQQPYQATSTYAAPAKSNTGKIVGIIVGLLAIVAIAVCLILFVFNKKENANGTYVWNDWASFGLTGELIIDDDEFTMTLTYDYEGESDSEVAEGTVKLDGDEIILTLEGDDLVCAYDSKEGTITISGEDSLGIDMVFVKED